MTLEDFRLSITAASLLDLATLLEAMATELRSREMNLQAAALRIDADNLRHYHRISVRATWGNSVTDDLPRAPRVGVGEEGAS